MTAHALAEPDHVHDAVAAELGIDPAVLVADLRDAIAEPLAVGGER